MKSPQQHHSFQHLSPPQTLFRNRVMDLVSSRVRCERTGMEKTFYRLDFPSWVNIIARTEKAEILLIRQYRFGTDQVEIEIPGGAVNDGEPVLEAGLRELLEETGYGGENAQIIGKVCPNPAIQDNLCFTVLVNNATKIQAPNFDDMEDIEAIPVAEDEVFELVRNGSISHGLVLNGLMFYAMHRQKKFW